MTSSSSCTCEPYPFGTGPEADCPEHGRPAAHEVYVAADDFTYRWDCLTCNDRDGALRLVPHAFAASRCSWAAASAKRLWP